MRTFDTRDFRRALSGFSTGVTVITSVSDSGEMVGMTASSFNSVSTDPPLILWSVTKTALSAPVFKNARYFAVHVLAVDQIELSNKFSKSGTDKFEHVAYSQDSNGVPVIDGAVARFDCSTWAVNEGGDHWVVIGEVHNIQRENKEALVFSDGAYATASPIRHSTPAVDNNGVTDSPIDNLLIYNLARAYHQMSGRFHGMVRDSGLSIPAWRILASIYGNVSRSRADLEARTFLDSEALADALARLQEEGLCKLGDAGDVEMVTGTEAGNNRIEHLFSHGARLDITAIGAAGEEGLQQLIGYLAEVVRNTND